MHCLNIEASVFAINAMRPSPASDYSSPPNISSRLQNMMFYHIPGISRECRWPAIMATCRPWLQKPPLGWSHKADQRHDGAQASSWYQSDSWGGSTTLDIYTPHNASLDFRSPKRPQLCRTLYKLHPSTKTLHQSQFPLQISTLDLFRRYISRSANPYNRHRRSLHEDTLQLLDGRPTHTARGVQ